MQRNRIFMKESTLSVEETNKLRAQLGLKPLNENENILKSRNEAIWTDDAIQRLEKSRKKRLFKTIIGNESLVKAEKLSAKDWIQKKKTRNFFIKAPKIENNAEKDILSAKDGFIFTDYSPETVLTLSDEPILRSDSTGINKSMDSLIKSSGTVQRGNIDCAAVSTFKSFNKDPNYVEVGLPTNDYGKDAHSTAIKWRKQVKKKDSIGHVPTVSADMVQKKDFIENSNTFKTASLNHHNESGVLDRMLVKRAKTKKRVKIKGKYVFKQKFLTADSETPLSCAQIFSNSVDISQAVETLEPGLVHSQTRRPQRKKTDYDIRDIRDILVPQIAKGKCQGAAQALNYFTEGRKSSTVIKNGDENFNNSSAEANAGSLQQLNFKFDLTYRDDNGKILTPKEAYKYLSHKFHGKAPGRFKKEKLRQKGLEK